MIRNLMARETRKSRSFSSLDYYSSVCCRHERLHKPSRSTSRSSTRGNCVHQFHEDRRGYCSFFANLDIYIPEVLGHVDFVLNTITRANTG